jgi:hypothetical protein
LTSFLISRRGRGVLSNEAIVIDIKFSPMREIQINVLGRKYRTIRN